MKLIYIYSALRLGPNGAPSSMTVSVATILFAMVLGAFGRP